MKKITSLLLLFFVLKTSSAQEISKDTVKLLTSKDYLKISKAQKTGGWILLGSGILLGSIGAINSLKETARLINVINPDPNAPRPNEKKIDAGLTLMLVGTVASLTSISFFVSSSKNKRKAASISFTNQIVPQMNRLAIGNKVVPSLTLKVRL